MSLLEIPYLTYLIIYTDHISQACNWYNVHIYFSITDTFRS